jgi:hypothetical protein
VAATHPQRVAPPPARRRWTIGAVAAAVVAAAAVLLILRGPGRAPAQGARVIHDRETITLGDRGVAVAEAGTEITWTVSAAGAAEVHQTRGNVFYRVEHGGPFEVETPSGRVIVRGTCFRVEVLNMNVSRQSWIGGALGAAVAATVVIAVYEGHVRVVNAQGQVDARAGDRIALAAGAAPRPDGSATDTMATVEPPPAGSATMPELLRRDQSHRGEIALLRARLRALEAGASPSTRPGGPDGPGEDAAGPDHAGIRTPGTFDLTAAELADMAKHCAVHFDLPGYGIEPRLMTDKLASLGNLSADDRAVYDQIVRQENDRYMTALRELYRELTGEPGDSLDARAMATEIQQKSPVSDGIAARKRIAEERAGIAAPPANTRTLSVIERLFRLETSAGDTLEQLLAAELGPDKAHRIRQTGWPGGDTSFYTSCSD